MDLQKLHIIYYPDPRLRKPSAEIDTIDETAASLAARMFEIMHDIRGLGLAAPQAGINRRLFVTDHTGEGLDERVYINPELVLLEGSIERDEGCLSLPDLFIPITRAARCRIRATGLDGMPFEEEATDLLARAWQHEMDHLNGILICDLMSPAQRIASRRMLKKFEDDYKRGQAGSRVLTRRR
jgi:peptide deformylase